MFLSITRMGHAVSAQLRQRCASRARLDGVTRESGMVRRDVGPKKRRVLQNTVIVQALPHPDIIVEAKAIAWINPVQ